MNEHLKELVQLSTIDKKIDAFEPRINDANKKVRKIDEQKESIEHTKRALNSEIEDATLKKRKNELHLAELSQKLKDNSSKSAEVKNEREMKSLQLEEEIAKEQITFANEEIERLDKVIDNKKAQIKEQDDALVALDQESASVQDEVAKELALIDNERQEVFATKQKLLAQINQKGLSFYEKIRRWAKNETVVPVRKQACYGCFMKLNDKVYADVILGEEIVTCPHCGRILYRDEAEQDQQSA